MYSACEKSFFGSIFSMSSISQITSGNHRQHEICRIIQWPSSDHQYSRENSVPEGPGPLHRPTLATVYLIICFELQLRMIGELSSSSMFESMKPWNLRGILQDIRNGLPLRSDCFCRESSCRRWFTGLKWGPSIWIWRPRDFHSSLKALWSPSKKRFSFLHGGIHTDVRRATFDTVPPNVLPFPVGSESKSFVGSVCFSQNVRKTSHSRSFPEIGWPLAALMLICLVMTRSAGEGSTMQINLLSAIFLRIIFCTSSLVWIGGITICKIFLNCAISWRYLNRWRLAQNRTQAALRTNVVCLCNKSQVVNFGKHNDPVSVMQF